MQILPVDSVGVNRIGMDPTIRRCLGFARREGYAGIVVGNVYAYRATNPKALLDAANPFDRIVCAWGANVIKEHAFNTACALKVHGARLMCLGITKAGHPKHPLYLSANAPFVEWGQP